MYNASFSPNTLDLFQTRDFVRDSRISNADFRAQCVRDAYQLSRSGFSNVRLKSHNLRGKTVYQTTQWPDALVLRKIEKNIKTITRVRQNSRLDIVRNIKALCSEGLPFRIYKLDIETFFESVDIGDTINKLQNQIPYNPTTIMLLSTFLRSCENSNISGIPRGLSLSATLSEFLLRDFDNTLKSWGNLFYFSRFVDDMIIVSRGDENSKTFLRAIKNTLPKGLNLNYAKTQIIDFSDFDKHKSGKIENKIDFLGYQFSVKHVSASKYRDVILDISQKKVKKIKTRLTLCFLQYAKDNNLKDLEDRIRLLTANYFFLDYRDNQFRQAGIFYNYRLINQPSASLQELDLYLKKMVNTRSGRICGKISISLGPKEKRTLLSYSFVRGFQNRHHFKFKNDRMEKLMRCWKYA